MNILIIEDEIMSAEDLAALIMEAEPSVIIKKTVSSVKEAIAYLKTKESLDLIFTDIQLGDGLSFDIFKTIPVSVPVIFCTAYNQYAIEAFKSNGIDYILKPFDAVSVTNAMAKYHQLQNYFRAPEINYDDLIKQLQTRKQPSYSSILVYQKDKVFPIQIENIALFYITTDVTHLLSFDKKSYIISNTLDELEQMSEGRFFRVNRQCLVNRNAIKSASVYFNRKYLVHLSIEFPAQVIVSKNRVTEFLQWLTQQ